MFSATLSVRSYVFSSCSHLNVVHLFHCHRSPAVPCREKMNGGQGVWGARDWGQRYMSS